MKDAIRDAIWGKFLRTKNYTDVSNRKSKAREYLAVLVTEGHDLCIRNVQQRYKIKLLLEGVKSLRKAVTKAIEIEVLGISCKTKLCLVKQSTFPGRDACIGKGWSEEMLKQTILEIAKIKLEVIGGGNLEMLENKGGGLSSIENENLQCCCQKIRVGCLQGKNSSMSFYEEIVDCTLKRSTLTAMRLTYPTGKVLLTEEKVEFLVEFFERIFLVIPDITNDCILRHDFLVKTELNKEFFKKVILRNSGSIGRISKELINNWNNVFQENSGNFLTELKEDFSKFLQKFSEQFEDDIVAGNCGIVEHVIELTDSYPIKQ
ncbi:krab-a domain-containing protein, partial [Vespula maculifrons]